MRAVFGSTDALAAELVAATIQAATDAIAARGRFVVALTGGSAAQTLYPVLAQAALPWQHVHVVFGDERCVPPDHADSNHHLAQQTLLSRVPIPADNIHRLPGEDPDLTRGARRGEQALLEATGGTGAVDVVHLGMGPDGHVCSLFEGHALLREERALVAPIADSPKPPAQRLTMTLQALARARSLWFLVTGDSKAEAVHDTILVPGCPLPAALAASRAASTRWLLDTGAARLLK